MRFIFKSAISAFIMSVLLVTGFASTAFAQSRVNAINASQSLFNTSLNLADQVRTTCGCRNTATTLEKIANAATEVELEARFGTAWSATEKLKDVIRSMRELRQYLPLVPNSSLSLRIKREITMAVNEAGSAVMGSAWVIARAASYGSGNSTLDAQMDGIEANLNFYPNQDF